VIDNYARLAETKQSLAPLVADAFCLRLLRAEDLPTTLAWRNREDIRVQFIHSDIITWEQHLAWWEQYQAKNNDFVFIIEETQQLHRPVGQVSLYNIDLEKREAEYGRLMIGDNEARGRGLAKRATELLIAWAFNSVGLKRIYLEVFANNRVAVNLYRRSGFVPYGKRGDLCLMRISKKSMSSVLARVKGRDSSA
jgi:RimJ/RimL family protein N-acetyltransferase